MTTHWFLSGLLSLTTDDFTNSTGGSDNLASLASLLRRKKLKSDLRGQTQISQAARHFSRRKFGMSQFPLLRARFDF